MATILSPGEPGARGASIMRTLDAACALDVVEIEVPSQIGRNVDRVAWVWMMHSITLVSCTPEMRETAIDLGWLGAPLLVALHVACAEHLQVDHFVTAHDAAASWAAVRGLDVVTC